MKKGRQRVVRFEVKLNYEEDEKLRCNSEKCKISKSEYVRRLIMNKKIREKPDDKFYEVMTSLTRIGNNLNQIARKANSLNIIDSDLYNFEARKWNKFMNEVKENYL